MFLLISISVILIISSLLMKKIRNDDIKNGHYINKEEYTIMNTLLHSLRKKEKREEIEKRKSFRNYTFDGRVYIFVVCAVAVNILCAEIFREGDVILVFVILVGLFSVLSFYLRSLWYLILDNITVLTAVVTAPCISTIMLGVSSIAVSIWFLKEYILYRKKKF